jgi:hypothetical protein
MVGKHSQAMSRTGEAYHRGLFVMRTLMHSVDHTVTGSRGICVHCYEVNMVTVRWLYGSVMP